MYVYYMGVCVGVWVRLRALLFACALCAGDCARDPPLPSATYELALHRTLMLKRNGISICVCLCVWMRGCVRAESSLCGYYALEVAAPPCCIPLCMGSLSAAAGEVGSFW